MSTIYLALLQDLEAHYLSGENSSRYPGDPAALAEAALLRGLLGDQPGALATLERAYELGWAGYFEAVNEPAWAGTIAAPGFAGLLEKVRARVEEQRAIVEQIDAEQDFRAEFEALVAAAAGQPADT